MSLMRTIGEFGESLLSKPENIAITIAIIMFLISILIWGI